LNFKKEVTRFGQQAMREFAERYAAAWCSRDPAQVAACYAERGSLKVNSAAPAVGRIAIREVAQGFMDAFPDMRVTMDDLRVQGTRAEFHWTLFGTNTGPGGKGHRVRISGFEEWTVSADGLIAASEGHFDEVEYQRQLAHGIE
jgi:nuclear transport factor 2 (NTF2) superfamily protein